MDIINLLGNEKIVIFFLFWLLIQLFFINKNLLLSIEKINALIKIQSDIKSELSQEFEYTRWHRTNKK